MRRSSSAVALLAVLVAGCDGAVVVVQPSQTATIRFTLRSTLPPPPEDPMQRAAAQYCVRNLLGRSSLALSFSDSGHYMTEDTIGLAEVVVSDVPRGQTHFVVVHDIHQCAADPGGGGITVHGLSANGVPLTRVEPYPIRTHAGSVPSLVFTVTADGRVEP
jgi:hypothetical protein